VCSLGETMELQYGEQKRQVDRLLQVYDYLYAVQCPQCEMCWPPWILAQLRDLIGYQSYYSGRLPEIPMWVLEVPCAPQ